MSSPRPGANAGGVAIADSGESINPTRTLILEESRHADTANTQSVGFKNAASLDSDVQPPIDPSLLPGYLPEVQAQANRYELSQPLAQGGIGEVWVARQAALHRSIAIKRLRSDRLSHIRQGSAPGTHPVEVAFYHEALLTANLDHPNILPVNDLVMDREGRLMLAMKLVRGTVWTDLIRVEFQKLDVVSFLKRHLRILNEVCRAVAFAHSRGVVHRDLKPAQVMVGEFDEVLLMDWGLALIADPPTARERIPDVMNTESVPTLLTARGPAGTPSFMAPEQLDPDCRRIGKHTDIFLIGGILYQLLTGASPYGGVDAQTAMYRASECNMVPAQQRTPNRYMPPELVALSRWAMDRDLTRRTPSVAIFMDHITSYLENAGRRWESAEMTMHVAESLQSKGLTVKNTFPLLAQIDQAEALWRENPDIETLRASAIAAYTSMLTTGDYQTAIGQAYAEQLHDDRLRTFVVTYLDRAWAEKKRRSIFMTQFLILATLSCIAIIGYIAFDLTRDALTKDTPAAAVEE